MIHIHSSGQLLPKLFRMNGATRRGIMNFLTVAERDVRSVSLRKRIKTHNIRVERQRLCRIVFHLLRKQSGKQPPKSFNLSHKYRCNNLNIKQCSVADKPFARPLSLMPVHDIGEVVHTLI